MRLHAKVTCPHCGFEQVFFTEDQYGSESVLCYAKFGGCGTHYNVVYSAKLSAYAEPIETDEVEIHRKS